VSPVLLRGFTDHLFSRAPSDSPFFTLHLVFLITSRTLYLNPRLPSVLEMMLLTHDRTFAHCPPNLSVLIRHTHSTPPTPSLKPLTSVSELRFGRLTPFGRLPLSFSAPFLLPFFVVSCFNRSFDRWHNSFRLFFSASGPATDSAFSGVLYIHAALYQVSFLYWLSIVIPISARLSGSMPTSF